MRVLFACSAILLLTSSLFAEPTYVGYSGAPGRQTCAASCHGLAGGTVQVSGFPNQYTPSQSYLITVRKMSGLPIKNFNASVRFATGSANAGLISAGEFTEIYDVFGETNGVHMTTLDLDSATFTWTAPNVGFGIVRFYMGAHQGPGDTTGMNTTIVLPSTEAPTLPGPASSPSPFDGQTSVSPDAALQWQAGSGAESHDIYFGTDSIPPLIVQGFEGVFFDPDPDMNAGATYFWHIDARNSNGVTPGPLWTFTVMNMPGPATAPIPADSATNVPVDMILEWTTGQDAVSHDVYLGFSPDSLSFAANVTEQHYVPAESLLYDTTYFWRVDERNPVGVTPGTVWRFATETANIADQPGATIPAQYTLGPVYPNPFNATVTIPFALPQAGAIRLTVYDVLGREVALLASGNFAAGTHAVSWSRDGASSEIYFVKLVTSGGTITGKMVALK
jgi:hypothetical protein